MTYISQGTGAGEIQLDCSEVPPRERSRLITTVLRFKQVKKVHMTYNGWLIATTDMAQLSGENLSHALGVLESRIKQTIHAERSLAKT